MYRVVILSGTAYAKEIDMKDEDELENIQTFVSEGTPVILTQDLEDLESWDIGFNTDDIVIVRPE